LVTLTVSQSLAYVGKRASMILLSSLGAVRFHFSAYKRGPRDGHDLKKRNAATLLRYKFPSNSVEILYTTNHGNPGSKHSAIPV
jgi:hypothetical protein